MDELKLRGSKLRHHVRLLVQMRISAVLALLILEKGDFADDHRLMRVA
jgi:hypothetical protein